MQKVETKDVFKEGHDWEKGWSNNKDYYPFVRERATHALFIPMGMAKSLASTVYIQYENGFLKIFGELNDKFTHFDDYLNELHVVPKGRLYGESERDPIISPFKREIKFLGWERICVLTGQFCGLHIPKWFKKEWAYNPTAVLCTLEEWEEIKAAESISCVKYVLGVKGVKSRMDFINKASSYSCLRYTRNGKTDFYNFMSKCGFTHKKESKTELKNRAFRSIVRRFKNRPMTKSESSFFAMIIGAAKMKRFFRNSESISGNDAGCLTPMEK